MLFLSLVGSHVSHIMRKLFSKVNKDQGPGPVYFSQLCCKQLKLQPYTNWVGYPLNWHLVEIIPLRAINP